MALVQCVKDILCSLSAGVRNGLADIVRIYLAQIDALIAKNQLTLTNLDIATAPLNILNDLAQTSIAAVKSEAELLPLDAITECVEFGDVSFAIQENLDALLVNANVLTNDLSRVLSYKDELEARVAELRRVRDLYVDVLAQIDICNALGI